MVNSISLTDFYFLNPEINTQCSNLVLGVAYCVQPVGDIQTYSGYPKTTNYITLTSNTYTTTTSSSPPKLPLPSATSTSLLPHASGTLSNCYIYKNYRDIPAIIDQSQSDTLATFTDFVNTCGYVTTSCSVSQDNLIKWNPSLDAKNCTLKPGFSYCVLQSKDSNQSTLLQMMARSSQLTYELDATSYFSTCMNPVNVNIVPQGTDATCSCYSEVDGDDYPDAGKSSPYCRLE